MAGLFRRYSGLILAAWLATGCSGIQHRPPDVSDADTRSASVEIESYSAATPHDLTPEQARERLGVVYGRIKPAAVDVCRDVGESRVCAWVVQYSEERAFNAVALEGNQVVVFHEIIAATESDDELAFVLAHELGHHIADHIEETRDNRNLGILAAAAAMAALGRGTGCTTTACLQGLQQASQASMQVGGEMGQRVFSVEQEKEADYLAAHILGLAGYDLARSRDMLLKIGTRTDRQTSSFLSTHPAGPERLASYDKTIETVTGDADGLPGEALSADVRLAHGAEDAATEAEEDAQEPDPAAFDPEECRIYLPEENVCIR